MTTGYSRILIRAIGLGLFAGGFGLVYLWLVHEGIGIVWSDWETTGWFSGSAQIVVIPIVTGLLVGLVYRWLSLPTRFDGFIEELRQGRVEPKTAPGAVLVALLSLVGGSSLGPEAPLGTAGGAAGTWIAERAGGDEEEVRQTSFMGISAMFGGLLSTPIGGPLLAFELEHDQSHAYYYRHLIPGMLAGAVAFGVMWPVIGAPFSGLLAIPRGDFESWMLLAAAGLGLFGALTAVVVGKILVGINAAMRSLDRFPVLRGLTGGTVVAAVGFVLPLTLFSGQESTIVVLENMEAIGVGTLLALALLKSVALGASLGGGFYGGPIFPMFFIGAVLGVVAHLVFPALPLGIAVGGTMAALGAAVSLLPLSMAILASILVQSGLVASGAIVVAAAVAYAIRVAVTSAEKPSDTARASSPAD